MKIDLVLFSPTGGTEKAARIVSNRLGEAGRLIALTDPTVSFGDISFNKDDSICLIAVPSFGGRVPDTASKRIQQLHGNGTKAVLMAVYGGREFEDTLVELQDLAAAAGFVPVAAIAALAEHSVSRKFAAGRPDANDSLQLEQFADSIASALAKESPAVLNLPGNRPYKEYKASPGRPMANENCTQCGLCVTACPVAAIPADDPSGMDTDRCIACMACASICPANARHLAPQFLANVEHMLEKICTPGKENTLYL